jgi:hypothetical protein
MKINSFTLILTKDARAQRFYITHFPFEVTRCRLVCQPEGNRTFRAGIAGPIDTIRRLRVALNGPPPTSSGQPAQVCTAPGRLAIHLEIRSEAFSHATLSPPTPTGFDDVIQVIPPMNTQNNILKAP